MSEGRLGPGRDISYVARYTGDEDMNHCPSVYGRHPILTNDAASPTMTRITITRNTAPPSCMGASRYALTHQHARSCGGLKDIVNALDLKRRTFFIRARADGLRDSLCLYPRDVSVNMWFVARWTQICFAAHKNDGDDRATNRPHFFDPLVNSYNISLFKLVI